MCGIIIIVAGIVDVGVVIFGAVIVIAGIAITAVVSILVDGSDSVSAVVSPPAPGETLSSIASATATLSSMVIDVAFERDALFLKRARRDYLEDGRCTGDY